jgi:hypothetical protein
MATIKVEVPYQHDSANLSTIYLGITDQARPSTWKPAFRDINRTGKRPVRTIVAYFPSQGRTVKVWVRDASGDRPSHTQTV